MPDSLEISRITAAPTSVSDKIRALDSAGVSRADIARFLNKRYQHVRNVLEGDKHRSNVQAERSLPARHLSGSAEPTPSPAGAAPSASGSAIAFFRLGVDQDGGLMLPRHVVEAFGGKPGEVLVAVASPGELVLRTSAAAVSRAQDLVRCMLPGEDSLAESLVADRRREVEHERLGG